MPKETYAGDLGFMLLNIFKEFLHFKFILMRVHACMCMWGVDRSCMCMCVGSYEGQRRASHPPESQAIINHLAWRPRGEPGSPARAACLLSH